MGTRDILNICLEAVDTFQLKRRRPPLIRDRDAVTAYRNYRLNNFRLENRRHCYRDGYAPRPVFCGDSMFELAGPMLPGVNRGIASDRILRHGSGVILDRFTDELLYPSPSSVFLWMGTNDIADEGYNEDVVLCKYVQCIQHLQLCYPGVPVHVLSVLHVRHTLGARLNPLVDSFNTALERSATALGAEYLEVRHLFGLNRLDYRDPVHLSLIGYQKLRKFLLPRIAAASSSGTFATSDIVPASQLLARHGSDAWSYCAHGASAEIIERNFIDPELDYLRSYVATVESGSPNQHFLSLYTGSRGAFYLHNRDAFSGLGEALTEPLSDASGLKTEFLNIVPSPAAELAPFNLLLVGDCLLEEVELLLRGQLLRRGILLHVDIVLSKNPDEQRKQIAARAEQGYDAVLFSPFTWDFDHEMPELLNRSSAPVGEVVERILSRTHKSLEYISNLFDCPVMVHNAALVSRASLPEKRLAKTLRARTRRAEARALIAESLTARVAEINDSGLHHVFVVDEASAVSEFFDEFELGAFLYYSDAIHPTRLSAYIAALLEPYVFALSCLVGKKAVVCDLDNTLWAGVIGEKLGVVPHDARQRVLMDLKNRGVVLTVCSKNDPTNVSWDGNVLSAEDFVFSAINWEPKALNIKATAEALNLNAKDFVFIDDRADEREMVATEFAGLVALDPASGFVWRAFEAWGDILNGKVGTDRTELYAQRAARRELTLNEAEGHSSEMFRSLALRADITAGGAAQLPRIHELVNRTNQWNLQGSRVTGAEVKEWITDAEIDVLVVALGDKFGDHGTVCVAVADGRSGRMEIPVFVLSCRVFGYGVETMVLAELERLSLKRLGRVDLVGRFTPTDRNAPCADMYSRHGFTRHTDGAWVNQVGGIKSPDWISATVV